MQKFLLDKLSGLMITFSSQVLYIVGSVKKTDNVNACMELNTINTWTKQTSNNVVILKKDNVAQGMTFSLSVNEF